MKLLTIAMTSIVSANEISPQQSVREFIDLFKLVRFYTPDFDERKYFAYGCNCLILGDKPISGSGYGKPVDALDMICKQYKVFYKKYFAYNILYHIVYMVYYVIHILIDSRRLQYIVNSQTKFYFLGLPKMCQPRIR